MKTAHTAALAVSALVGLAALPAHAELHYDYVDLDYRLWDSDRFADDLEGAGLKFSFGLTDHLYAVGEQIYVKENGSDADRSDVSAGLGLRWPLTSGIDAIGELRYIDSEINQALELDDEDKGYLAVIGARYQALSWLEMNAALEYGDILDDEESFYRFGVVAHVWGPLHLLARAEFSDVRDGYNAGLRVTF
jgi:hypothetical protein